MVDLIGEVGWGRSVAHALAKHFTCLCLRLDCRNMPTLRSGPLTDFSVWFVENGWVNGRDRWVDGCTDAWLGTKLCSE